MSESISEKNLKEQEKIKRFEEIKEEMMNNGYKENLGTITVVKANIYALLTAGPIALICFFIYINKWNSIILEFTPATLILCFISIIASVVIHEFLHGLTWSLFCKEGFKSIILGILLFIISFFIGNSSLMILSLINILCAGGDTTIALLLCKYKDALFIDHPTDCGFVAFIK